MIYDTDGKHWVLKKCNVLRDRLQQQTGWQSNKGRIHNQIHTWRVCQTTWRASTVTFFMTAHVKFWASPSQISQETSEHPSLR